MSTSARRVTVTGPRAPQTCWARYDELAAWPRWGPQITGVEAPATRLALGLSGVIRVAGGLRVRFTVTAVDRPAMTWSWIARVGPVVLDLHHGIVAHRSGSRATLTVQGPSLVVSAYAPLAWLALWRLVH